MGEGDLCRSGRSEGRRDARGHFYGDARGPEGGNLFPAPPEDKGVAALDAHDALAFPSFGNQERFDVFLRYGVMALRLAHGDAPGIASGQREHGLAAEAIVHDDVRLPEEASCAQGQEFGIPRPCAH